MRLNLNNLFFEGSFTDDNLNEYYLEDVIAKRDKVVDFYDSFIGRDKIWGPALRYLEVMIPSLMDVKGEEVKDIGGGMAILSLLLCPFFAMPLMTLGDYLERHYEKWNYKTEMEIKMV